ncbi:MAG: isoamylase early set domain-containing protein [Chloroflexi bacterium]|nr:isoamylase early set domain-containing protein [Chloroflexota bacterium]
MIVKMPGRHDHYTLVIFRYPSDTYAEMVHLVGDFNAWSQTSLPFDCCRSNEHYWELALELPAGGRYQYRYLVNGHIWVNDTKADDYVVDAEGNTNSVIMT